MKGQFTFCVSHKAPLVPEHLYDCVIGVGEYWPDCGIHISALDSFWHKMRPLAYGAAGNYAVRHAIRSRVAPNELAGLLSYRKVVVRKEGNSVPRGSLREISTAVAEQIKLEDTQPEVGQEYLVSSPIECPEGVSGQYAKWHHAIDLSDYLLIAVELGVIGSNELDDFACGTALIPGGCELGVFPASWLAETLNKLSFVGQEFLHRHGERVRNYDRYQVRAIGFLSERLGSYLLLKELRARYQNCIPTSIFGTMCVIVLDGAAYLPAVADK